MSNRTIIEFNHDLWYRIDKEPNKFVAELLNYLRCADEDGRAGLRQFGVAVLATVHHSTDIRVSFDKAT